MKIYFLTPRLVGQLVVTTQFYSISIRAEHDYFVEKDLRLFCLLVLNSTNSTRAAYASPKKRREKSCKLRLDLLYRHHRLPPCPCSAAGLRRGLSVFLNTACTSPGRTKAFVGAGHGCCLEVGELSGGFRSVCHANSLSRPRLLVLYGIPSNQRVPRS